MIRKKNKNKALPAISTASLPDIVFMLLFFFMVSAVMRDNTLMVQNALPKADQVEKLERKDLSMYIYIGKPLETYQSKFGRLPRIQLNDKFASLEDISSFVLAERNARREELTPKLTAALKIDAKVNMGIISDVKEKLRTVNQLKISYIAQKGSVIDQ